MKTIARLVSSLALAGCGEVVEVNLHEFPGCAPLVLGDSTRLIATADRANWPVTAYSSADRPAAFDWQSSAPNVITVTERGIAVARALGSATIRARAEGHTGSATLAVGAARRSATVSPESVRVRLGDSVFVAASAWDSSGAPIDLVQSQSLVYFAMPWSHGTVNVSEIRQDGAWVVGIGRGRTAISWTIAGRCGMLAATVY